MKYRVTVQIVKYEHYIIEADNRFDAVSRWDQGDLLSADEEHISTVRATEEK